MTTTLRYRKKRAYIAMDKLIQERFALLPFQVQRHVVDYYNAFSGGNVHDYDTLIDAFLTVVMPSLTGTLSTAALKKVRDDFVQFRNEASVVMHAFKKDVP